MRMKESGRANCGGSSSSRRNLSTKWAGLGGTCRISSLQPCHGSGVPQPHPDTQAGEIPLQSWQYWQSIRDLKIKVTNLKKKNNSKLKQPNFKATSVLAQSCNLFLTKKNRNFAVQGVYRKYNLIQECI